MGRSRQFAWHRTAAIAALLAVVLFGAVATPIVRSTLRNWDAEKLEKVYASGLSPCDSRSIPNDLYSYLHRYIPGAASLSITEYPSFSNAHALRIIGQDLYFVELNLPLYKQPDKASLLSVNDERPPRIYRSQLSAATLEEVSALFAQDITHAKTEMHSGLDGTGFEFRRPGGCAQTWSPAPESRAAKLTEIFYMLGKHAALSQPDQIAQSDRDIFAAAEALKVMQSGG